MYKCVCVCICHCNMHTYNNIAHEQKPLHTQRNQNTQTIEITFSRQGYLDIYFFLDLQGYFTVKRLRNTVLDHLLMFIECSGNPDFVRQHYQVWKDNENASELLRTANITFSQGRPL